MTAEHLRPSLHLAPLLTAERFGLITDFDGTISAIALRPEAAVPSPAARAALATLAGRLALVGAMSGRALVDLQQRMDLPELLYIGSHGLTWSYQGQDEIPEEVLPYVHYAERAASELVSLRDLPGVRVEEKGVGLAFHYRLAPNPDAARETILAAISGSPAAQRFEVREGIQVAELYPRVPVNKGTALRRVVERFELDALLFFGDDLTDIDAMYAATAVREDHQVRTASIAVRHAQSPALALEAADYMVDGVAGVEQALEWLAETVSAAPLSQARTDPEIAAPANEPGPAHGP